VRQACRRREGGVAAVLPVADGSECRWLTGVSRVWRHTGDKIQQQVYEAVCKRRGAGVAGSMNAVQAEEAQDAVEASFNLSAKASGGYIWRRHGWEKKEVCEPGREAHQA